MSLQRKKSTRIGKLRVAVLATLFRMLTSVLSPLILSWEIVGSRRRQSRLIRDVRDEMVWTMSNLHPQVTPHPARKPAMGRYATVLLRCPNYLVWITREFYWGGHDFWADFASLLHPDSRVRVDTLAKEIESSANFAGRESHPAIPTTLSDLDSMIHRLDPELKKRFSPANEGPGKKGGRETLSGV